MKPTTGRAEQENAGVGPAVVDLSKNDGRLVVIFIVAIVISGVGSVLFVDRNPSFQIYQAFLFFSLSSGFILAPLVVVILGFRSRTWKSRLAQVAVLLLFVILVGVSGVLWATGNLSGSALFAVGIPAFLLVFYFLLRVPEPAISYGDGSHSVKVDFSSPLNRGVLKYLRTRPSSRKAELESASPANVKNPFAKTSTHPEAGVRLWGELASSLPVDCRWIVCGVPALVHPQAGVLFGVALGTMYCLRLSKANKESALKAGARTEHGTLDLASQFGPDWVFGNWAQAELEWCRAEHEALGRAAADEAAPEDGLPLERPIRYSEEH